MGEEELNKCTCLKKEELKINSVDPNEIAAKFPQNLIKTSKGIFPVLGCKFRDSLNKTPITITLLTCTCLRDATPFCKTGRLEKTHFCTVLLRCFRSFFSPSNVIAF